MSSHPSKLSHFVCPACRYTYELDEFKGNEVPRCSDEDCLYETLVPTELDPVYEGEAVQTPGQKRAQP